MKRTGRAAPRRSTGARKSAKAARAATAKRAGTLGENTGDCKNIEKWTLLSGSAAPTGHTAVWVPNKTYDRVAAAFLKDHRTAAEKKSLRERRASFSLEMKCDGTCDGGWCAPLIISDDGSVKVWVCDCEYFV